MNKIFGSPSRLFVSLLLFVGTLVMTQAPFAQEVSAIGMSWSQSGPFDKRFVDVSASSDGMIAYATENPTGALRKIWKSTDGGASWTELTNAPSTSWGAIAVSGNGQIVFALSWDGADQEVYQSIDSGSNWTLAHTTANQLSDIAISDDGNTVVVAAAHGILKSTDTGESFALTSNPGGDLTLPLLYWQRIDISADGSQIVATTGSSSIFKSTNGGTEWTELASSGARQWEAIAISSDGRTIMGVARDEVQGVWFSQDGGQTFTAANIDTVFEEGQAVFGGMSDDGAVMIASSYYSSPYMSTDRGQTWSNTNLVSEGWLGFAISDTADPQRQIIASTENRGFFRYGPIPAPVITSVSPNSGSTFGGRSVILDGEHFINVEEVSFGGTPATSFNVDSAQSITAVAPAHIAGSVNISVTTENGTSQSEALYTYLTPPQPTLVSLTPSAGSSEGGSWVVLEGTEIRDVVSVTVGGVASTEFGVISDTQLLVIVPAGLIGVVDIVLTTEGGTATLSKAFSYVAPISPLDMGWTGLSSNANDGDVNGSINSVAQGPNGEIYILGSFEDASGEANADYVARWNGSRWVGLGQSASGDGVFSCIDDCYFSEIAISPTGDVFIAGSFDVAGLVDQQSLMKWDGSSWTSVISDADAVIYKMLFTAEGDLYVSGEFQNLADIPEADNVAKWNGSSWSALGSDGSGNGVFDWAYAMAFGSDNSLYVSGYFPDAGGTSSAGYLARWDGTTWSAVETASIDGQEFASFAYSLLVDSSTGRDVLYAGGCMEWGDQSISVARYDGTTWEELSGDHSLNGCVYDMEIAPTGALVVAGEFTSEIYPNMAGLATWTNNQWYALGKNQGAYFNSLEITSDSRVIVGGAFQDLGDSASADQIAISQPIALLRNIGTTANVTPNVGNELGGTTVTLTGTNFSQATQVKFGTKVATNLTVISADSISVTTPANAPGVVDVSIISPSGTRVFPGAFTYFEPVSSVVDTEEEVLLLPERSITPSIQFVAGDSQTISVPGFVPGERVQIILASTPQLLAGTTADASGVATFTFVFPRDVEGFHTLAVFAPVSARGMRQAIFIHPVGTVIGLGALPKTGSGIQLWLPFVIAILGFLLITISGNRRRKIA
jgi:hypothetical protein